MEIDPDFYSFFIPTPNKLAFFTRITSIKQLNNSTYMPELQGLSLKVFNDRYALKDGEGKQTERAPEEMWSRVARAIAEKEKTDEARAIWEEKFYSALQDFKFVPGGRILSGAGTGAQLTFYNCFVIPSPEDSRGGILDNVKLMVEIMSRGGGVGVNLSTLRPKGSYVRGVNGTASGSVSFGGLYSYATGLIIQGGSRRGALMLMLNDDHPDIEDFITVKRTMGLITNANLSVCVSDALMEAVKEDRDWELKWGGKVYRTLKARELWDKICESAWSSGEPGVVFIDRYNQQSNTWYYEKIICVNPCGEQGLSAWGVCNLGAVNLAKFERDGRVDYLALRETVRTAIRFLDNVIEATQYIFEENRTAQMQTRRVGLGTMGLADLLIKMKIRYGNREALDFCENLYKFIRDEAYVASVEIAKEKGAFPRFEVEKYLDGQFIKHLPENLREAIRIYGIRNAVLLTQAPTGTTGILAEASSGIEPIYDFVLTRKDRLGEHEVYHLLYEEFKTKYPNEKLPEYFVTAKQLSPEEHIRMQAIIQKYVDSSISKTINAPETHTATQVKDLYMLAYDLGCKGVTYFRDGSRDDAVLKSKEEKKAPPAEIVTETKQEEAHLPPPYVFVPKPRPDVTSGSTYKVKTGYGTLFVTVNNDEEGKPFEVFATIGKTGGFFAAKSEAICRLISLGLRSSIPAETIIDQIKGIRGPMPSWGKYGQILSIPDAIAHVMLEHIQKPQAKLNLEFNDGKLGAEMRPESLQGASVEPLAAAEIAGIKIPERDYVVAEAPAKRASIADIGHAPECPECGGILAFKESCMLCPVCGYSKCG